MPPRAEPLPSRSGAAGPRFGLGISLVLFGIPALMLYGATYHLIPVLAARGMGPLPAWFVAGGVCVFLPLLIAALMGARFALPRGSWRARLAALRLRRLSRRDWLIAGAALLFTFAATGAMQQIAVALWPGFAPHPPFLSIQPLTPEQYWIFLAWLPFFFANIVGEELWWRGYIQTRQEPVFGAYTWLVQAVLHGAFHFSFGAGLLFILWPALLGMPWAVQRTGNTTTAIVVHAGFNGTGFLAVTLGLLPG